MSLAGGRAPRKTAGNRLSGLLEAEEEDEFYQTTYGGFTEESGDDEYQGDQSDTEDEVDSDFDIDEGDEPSSDGEAEEPRRKRRIVTKAYKEPLKSLRPRKVSSPAVSAQKVREEKVLLPLELQDDGTDSRKSMRQSTAEHTRQTFLRVQERQGQSRRRKGPHCERPLTQEELLREAKITEELNLRSLETYERLEADKKKQVHKKRKCPGPIITYHSVTVPLVGELGPKEENVDVEGLCGCHAGHGVGSTMSSYQKELEKYRDIDEDEILRTLSPEELEQLDCELQEMDPENMLLPAGLRQRDQTKKSPTGPLDREALLQYLEQQALEVKERDDLVPYTGEKKGKPFIEPKREIPAEEQITLEPELEEALAHATDAEMCDIAAILGMYTLMSNKQYYDAICSGEICNTEGISSVVQPDKYKPVPDEPPNPTKIEEILQSVRGNDKELEEVNLNNIQDIPMAMLTELCEAMKTNTHVRSFSLAATKSGDPIANAVADMLRENRSLQSLNVESNFISSMGLMAVLKAVRENATLTELRVDNQRQWPGDAVEMEMATVLEQCPSIVRFGYHFTQQGPRARAAQAMTRNNELRRQQQKR